jgi:hypothetical protein
MTSSWQAIVLSLAQTAQEHYRDGHVDAALADVDGAFAVVATRGSESDLAFASLLLVTADIVGDSGDVETSAALYRRATDTCAVLRDAPAAMNQSDLDHVEARALLGLARTDMTRGHRDRAQLRYFGAWRLLQSLPDVPIDLLEEARQGAGLDTSAT